MKADVLLGLQWGDEGKGKIVDVLTSNYDIIARFQGGPNAGHTLEFDGIKHVLHTIPSGIFHKGVINLIGNGVVIDPIIFQNEIIGIKKLDVKIFHNMKEGLKDCDIVMMLRIQKERIVTNIMPNEKLYFNKYGLDYKKLAYAKKNAFVMHPGPMNRGVEIDSKLADDITRSLIQEQVSMGVAIRMSCLEILIRNKDLYGK